MLYSIKFHEEAYQELIDATEWYESEMEGLGKQFLNAIDTAVNRIIQNPEYYSKISANFRQLKVHNFPFTIVYEIYPNELIHIAAVHHTKRNPRRRLRKL